MKAWGLEASVAAHNLERRWHWDGEEEAGQYSRQKARCEAPGKGGPSGSVSGERAGCSLPGMRGRPSVSFEQAATTRQKHQKGSQATPACVVAGEGGGGPGGWGMGSHQLQLPAISRVGDLQPEMKSQERLG